MSSTNHEPHKHKTPRRERSPRSCGMWFWGFGPPPWQTAKCTTNPKPQSGDTMASLFAMVPFLPIPLCSLPGLSLFCLDLRLDLSVSLLLFLSRSDGERETNETQIDRDRLREQVALLFSSSRPFSSHPPPPLFPFRHCTSQIRTLSHKPINCSRL